MSVDDGGSGHEEEARTNVYFEIEWNYDRSGTREIFFHLT